MENKSGFDLLTEALGDKATNLLAPIKEETKNLFQKMGGDQIIKAKKWILDQYKKVGNITDQGLKSLALQINGKTTHTDDKNKQISENIENNNQPTSEMDSSNNNQPTSEMDSSSSIEYPELVNKKIMEFDAGLSVIQSPGFGEFRISNKIDKKKLSAEQLKNLAAFDKVQASLYIMLRNASKRDLPQQFLMKASVVMTKDLFDHMGSGSTGGGFDLSKLTEGAKDLAYNKTIGTGVGDLKKGVDGLIKSFKESRVSDMIVSVQTWLSMINSLPDITSKWNNFLGWIADGDVTGVNLANSTLPSIYTVFQGCKSGYPSAEQIQGLNVIGDDADWISKNSDKMLSTNASILGHFNDHTEQVIKSIINPKKQKSLNKFVSQSESIINKMIEAVTSAGLSSDIFESIIASWGKRFEKFAFIGRMLGVDMTPLISTLNAKLSPKQEQQLTKFLQNYKPSTAEGSHPWEKYISDDPESKKQSIIKMINLGDIKQGLFAMTPSASVVEQVVGDDMAKKALYFDKDEEGNLTILKDWSKVSEVDKRAVVEGYMTNENVIKNLLKDVTGVNGDDMKVVGRVATGYMVGARGAEFYKNYESKHVNDNNKSDGLKKQESKADYSPQSDVIMGNNKVKAKESWKQYEQEPLFKLPTDIKYDFAVTRLLGNYPTSSTMGAAEEVIMNIASSMAIPPFSAKDIAANIWLGFDGIAFGETSLNINIANQKHDDQGQKMKGYFGRSVDGDPDKAIANDIANLKKNPLASSVSSKIDSVKPGTGEYYVLSYLGYLFDRVNIVKGISGMYGNPNFEPFKVLANISNYCDGKLGGVSELDKQIKYYFQGADAVKGKTGEMACKFVRSSLQSQITY